MASRAMLTKQDYESTFEKAKHYKNIREKGSGVSIRNWICLLVCLVLSGGQHQKICIFLKIFRFSYCGFK